MYESKSDYKCDYTIVVATDRNTQYERLIERPTIDSSMASKIIDSQMNINEKIKLCDFMIWNSGNHKQLNKQIEFYIMAKDKDLESEDDKELANPIRLQKRKLLND